MEVGRLPWFWIGLGGFLLLAPGPVFRILVDLIGGLTLLLVLLPLLLAGGGWVAWRLLRSRFRTCPACGTASVAMAVCPACGSALDGPIGEVHHGDPQVLDIPARDVTIDIQARSVGE